MTYPNIIAEALKELKQSRKDNWPDHVVAQAAYVQREVSKLNNIAIDVKYSGRDSEDLGPAIIKVIAAALRFKENLK